MISLTGKKLEDYVQAIPNISDYKKRFCYDDFKNLVVNTIDMKVVALYGLLFGPARAYSWHSLL